MPPSKEERDRLCYLTRFIWILHKDVREKLITVFKEEVIKEEVGKEDFTKVYKSLHEYKKEMKKLDKWQIKKIKEDEIESWDITLLTRYLKECSRCELCHPSTDLKVLDEQSDGKKASGKKRGDKKESKGGASVEANSEAPAEKNYSKKWKLSGELSDYKDDCTGRVKYKYEDKYKNFAKVVKLIKKEEKYITFEEGIPHPNGAEMSLSVVTSEWYQIDAIRKIRNEHGHPSKTGMTEQEFKNVLRKFKEIYKVMQWDANEIKHAEQENWFETSTGNKEVALSYLKDLKLESEAQGKKIDELEKSLLEMFSAVDNKFKVFKAEVKEEILTEVEEKMQALKIENLEKVEKAKDISQHGDTAKVTSCGAEEKCLPEKIESFEEKLSDMAYILSTHMKGKNISTEKLKSWMSTLPLSVNIYVFHLWESIDDEIKSSTNFDTIFAALNMKIWNILDYDLFEYLIKKSEAHELKTIMNKYKCDIEEFKKKTLVSNFVKSWKGRSRKFPNFDELEVKYEEQSLTLADLDTFRQEVFEECIPSMAQYSSWVYKTYFKSGCFEVTWMLPKQLSVLVKRNITTMYEVLERYKVLQVVVAGVSVYNPCKFYLKGRFYSLLDLSSSQGQFSKKRISKSLSSINLSSTGTFEPSQSVSTVATSSGRKSTSRVAKAEPQPSHSVFPIKLDLMGVKIKEFRSFSKWMTPQEFCKWLKKTYDLPDEDCYIITDKSINGKDFLQLTETDLRDYGFVSSGYRTMCSVLQQEKKTVPDSAAAKKYLKKKDDSEASGGQEKKKSEDCYLAMDRGTHVPKLKFKSFPKIIAKLKQEQELKVLLSSQDYYGMASECHGVCLIINNNTLNKGLDERKGTDRDEENLVETWRYLGYHVEVRRGMSYQETINIFCDIDEFLNDVDRKTDKMSRLAHDSFVCCLLSHGDKSCIISSDSQMIPIDHLAKAVGASNILQRRPKIFFIQAYQGEGFSETKLHVRKSSIQSDSSGIQTTKRPHIFISYAIAQGKACRDTDKGSWYIDAVCKTLCEKSEQKTLGQLQEHIEKQVAQDEDESETLKKFKQQPTSSNELRKKVHFFYK